MKKVSVGQRLAPAVKKVFSLLLSFVMLLSVITVVNVSTYAASDAIQLNLNSTWTAGYITDENNTIWYKFSIPSDGVVTIGYMHYLSANCKFYTEDLSQSFGGLSCYSCHGSPDSPETTQFSYVLSKGTYYIKISKYQSNGRVKFKGTFKSYKNSEKEPNDYDNPVELKMNTPITGAITLQDSVDWYKFVVKEKIKININFKYYKSLDTVVYNSDLTKELWSIDVFSCKATEDSPKSYSFQSVLNKGVYYIKVQEHYSEDTGKYIINISEKFNSPSTFKVSTRSTDSLKLAWNKVGGVNGYQLQRKSGDSWKTIANTTSTSYTVKSLKAGTTYNFRVRAYKTINSTKYYSGWRTLKTPTKPSKPSIKTPSANKKHQIIAKWKKVSACSGYQVQYSTSSKFKSPTTKTVSGASKTSCTAKFKKGKKYYIRVRSYKTVDGKKYYSAWSSVKSIKCK